MAAQVTHTLAYAEKWLLLLTVFLILLHRTLAVADYQHRSNGSGSLSWTRGPFE